MGDIMVDYAETRYVFVVLQPNDGNKDAIRTIMKEGKNLANKGVMTFYSSFNGIYKVFSEHFPWLGMWGIGFSKNTLNMYADWLGFHKLAEARDEDLIYTKIQTDGVSFPRFSLKHNGVFFVAPNSKECETVWYAGRTDRGFKKWWCKGIHKGCCIVRDKDITNYLDTRKYEPYYGSNYTSISFVDQFPSTNLFQDVHGLEEHGYSVLNLTSKELREGIKFKKELKSNQLF